MYHSRCLAILSAISAVSLSLLSLPATAEPDRGSSQLLPLEAQTMTVETDPHRLESVADDINTSAQPEEKDSEDITDVIGADFIDDIVDEDGDVKLPMGLTIFSTLGTTSIGFGSDF
ncbi:MAG: hypothetical protein AAFY20_08760 [Cyanobacteria bacterium J06639_14]